MTGSALPELQQAIERLLAFLAQDGCTDAEFDEVAAQLFTLQYTHDEPYRRFCQRRGLTPRRLAGWRDIPPVPISAFKDSTLSCVPPDECERVFMTSGTTRGEVRGRNHHPVIAVWDLSMRRNFARRFMQGAPRMRMATLFPDEGELPNSSLARYLSLASRSFGAPGSRAYVSAAGGLDVEGVCRALGDAVAAGEAIALMGASFSFVHLLDALRERGIAFTLPAGSRILDTGGYKQQAREVPLDEFYDGLAQAFGVPRARCINMYGMTELSSQLYDDGNAAVPSVKSGPHWIRTRVLDPLTGREVAPGERGVLAHCDLANFNSATTILTEDVGVAVPGGFLLLGRAEGAEAKGCSLAVQAFLEAARP
ncbi:LuxE/PaaK family acyltransferase [Ramlibacter tataouinensis]|uniref:Long-chain-fatty-acid--luciferin-component ligase (Acyl-protein synthetase)-like protein n=1 Tax=Ramlibacter tataouinensis (strain ATCC BAA-407 / DSM 14655 / LMG 21543 / TTB310) TaxID=365046 RepID=F5Y0G8_RAMTT|nr:long-chain-fatty-acid--CoA ligase [Ramlibacter tataouinensis]AEG93374.1 long-chain-fatty-acid--luciferin-component ligase (Acyl- protein synthetase)-like protein [Ramlibacter tataouinensis TTB310]